MLPSIDDACITGEEYGAAKLAEEEPTPEDMYDEGVVGRLVGRIQRTEKVREEERRYER